MKTKTKTSPETTSTKEAKTCTQKCRNVGQLEQEEKELERPPDAKITQLLTEARSVIEQMSQLLQVAYQIGERLVKERNDERENKEEWKNRAMEAEAATKYWSQGFADLSAKVREEQRMSPRDANDKNKQQRQHQKEA